LPQAEAERLIPYAFLIAVITSSPMLPKGREAKRFAMVTLATMPKG
jgi:hypothetical protein